MADEYVITPSGYRPNSLVQTVEPGHILDSSGGRIRKLDPAGKLVADYGPEPARPGNGPLMPGNVSIVNPSLPEAQVSQPVGSAAAPGRVAGLASGWITYAFWNNSSGKPVTSFKTTWQVPPAPLSQNGQTVYLFNAIQNATNILQPVLQWGPSLIGFAGKLKLLALSITFAFLFCSPSRAQNAAPGAQSVEARTSTENAKHENQREQDRRVVILQELRREHSDESGRLRPDLFAKAIAQIQRMKVANQIGPDATVSPNKK